MSRAHAGTGGHGLLAVLSLVVTGACGQKRVDRPIGETLEAIEFEGNRSIKSSELRDGLGLRRAQKQGMSPDPYLVVVDGKRIHGQYVRHGFLEVDVRSRVERRGDRTTVIYMVREGPRAKTRVKITGLPANDPDLTYRMVRDVLALEDGEPFVYEPYDRAKERGLLLVEDAGYAHAHLDAYVVADRVNHEALVHFDYNLGPKSRFGTIEISGADGALAESVRARLEFDTGEVFSSAAIADSQRNIYDMRQFSMVRVMPDRTTGETVNVKISLVRASQNELTAGAGLGVDPATYEIRGRTGYSRSGWPSPLTDFSVDLRPAYAMMRDRSDFEPRVRALAKLRRIDLFRPFVVGEIEGGYNYLTVEAYTSYGPRVRLGIQTPLWTQALQLRAGWDLDRLAFRNISPLVDPALQMQLGIDGIERVGQYTQAISLDLRDSPIETTSGLFAELRVDEATPFAGSASTFWRVTPELRGFVSVPKLPIVLAARARGGRIRGDLPATERYFSGGATTHRGFGERRLAPSAVGVIDGDLQSVPIGGAELLETNFEVRARLGTLRKMGLGGVVFLDGGDVVDAEGSIDLGNLHWAAGLGARLLTIVGAVRADLAYRLNRKGFGEPEAGSDFAFHFSIGEAF